MRFELVTPETPDDGILGWADSGERPFTCMLCYERFPDGRDRFGNGALNLLLHFEDVHGSKNNVTWCLMYGHIRANGEGNAPLALVEFKDDLSSGRCKGHEKDDHVIVKVPELV
jgi:hypothetical protein